MNLPQLISALLTSAILAATAVPPVKRRQAGPCVGMDCMHGVLMHGDGDLGDDHKHEDADNKRQDELDIANNVKQSGPKDGMESLHGVLMHGASDSETVHMHQQAGPEALPEKAGPGEGMDFLHGVMMHGDTRPGVKHSDEHDEAKKQQIINNEQPKGPCIGMDCLHGVMMHSDTDTGNDHSQEHAHDQEKLLEKSGAKFSSPDLETAMHGRGHSDVDVHSDENKPPDQHTEGIPSIADPHEVIHGHLNEKIKTVALTADQADYQEWLKEKNNNDAEVTDSSYLGFSFPFISDSLLDNIETLKRRYLPKFWVTKDAKVEPERGFDEKKGEGDAAHELLDDMEIVGGTDPFSAHHQHHGSDSKGSQEKEGSGVTHDEG